MSLQCFKSQAPISDNILNTHTTKEDTLNRHNKPLTLACMFGDFWDMALFTHGENIGVGIRYLAV